MFGPVANGQTVETVMEKYLQDGFVFAEELFARAVESRLPAGTQPAEIPEPHRDPRAAIRFKVR